MNEKAHFVIFTLEDRKFAVPMDRVEKIARAAEVMPLPNAPDPILGVVNVQGAILPVVSLRRRFRLTDRPIGVEDHFLIGKTATRTIALAVDSVTDIVESSPGQITGHRAILDGLQHVEGVMKLEDGMVLIHDLEHVLSTDEDMRLETAMQKTSKPRKSKTADG
jgi:purine-binding chemotaxis protein CheW